MVKVSDEVMYGNSDGMAKKNWEEEVSKNETGDDTLYAMIAWPDGGNWRVGCTRDTLISTLMPSSAFTTVA